MLRIRRAFRFLCAALRHYWYCLFYYGWGGLNVTRKDWKDRVFICHRCKWYDPSIDECEACECIVTLKAKWMDQDCPKHKWDKSIVAEIFRLKYIDEEND